MVSLVLEASRREEKGKKIRKEGFIPAILYGGGRDTVQIKLKKASLNTILRKYGERANVRIKLDQDEKVAIIKAVDRDPLSEEILHADLQVIEETDVVNWEIPVIFTNKEVLETNRLSLVVSFSSVGVVGKVRDIPDFIEIDVGGKERNDQIKLQDLSVNPSVQFKMPLDTVLAVVK